MANNFEITIVDGCYLINGKKYHDCTQAEKNHFDQFIEIKKAELC